MTENVRVSLSLVDAIGKDLRGRRLCYLVREADDETREELEPFGYYSPQITVERHRSDPGPHVVITVSPGPPVPVRARIGRAYCTERVGQFVFTSVVSVLFKH